MAWQTGLKVCHWHSQFMLGTPRPKTSPQAPEHPPQMLSLGILSQGARTVLEIHSFAHSLATAIESPLT